MFNRRVCRAILFLLFACTIVLSSVFFYRQSESMALLNDQFDRLPGWMKNPIQGTSADAEDAEAEKEAEKLANDAAAASAERVEVDVVKAENVEGKGE